MPKILIFNGIWIFVIYATDMYENRKHVHVGQKDSFDLCKIWLEPRVEIAKPGELNIKQQKEVLDIAEKYSDSLLQQWNDFTNGKKIKTIKIR